MAIELTKDLLDIFHAALPEDEVQEALNELMLANIDDMDTFVEFLEALGKADGDLSRVVGLTHEPVSMTQFMEDPYFLGDVFRPFPGVKDMLIEAMAGGYVQWLGTGAIGIGKSTAAQIIQARGLYEMSCEKFPQARYGLMPTSSIVIAMMNKTDALAKSVTFGQFHQFLVDVPYFQDEFSFDPDIKSVMTFPKNIVVEHAAANAHKLLGKNVIAGILDEMNFQQRIEKSKQSMDGGFYDQAKTVFSSLVRRRKSRFERQGKLPGILCVVSSANYAGDFTDTLKQQVEKDNDGLTYVWDKPQWEVLPKERLMKETFTLEVGNERYRSRILPKNEEPREGATLHQVPMNYFKDATDDFDGFMRDIAGIVTVADRPFFYDLEKIWRMGDLYTERGMINPFMVETICLAQGMPEFNPDFQIAYPDAPRAIHIDLGLTGDACGFAMGFVSNVEAVTRRVASGKLVEEMPHVTFDCLMQIKAPKNGEIEFADVRELIYMLDDEGYNIKWVTFDGFQSVDSRQILKRQGYQSEVISVEGKEAYEALRTAIWQSRCAAPEHHIAFNELAYLKEDREKARVDHLPNKTKDVSDTMAGVYQNLMNQRASWRSTVPTFRLVDRNGYVRDVKGPTVETPRKETGRRDVVRRDPVRKDVVRRDPVRRP